MFGLTSDALLAFLAIFMSLYFSNLVINKWAELVDKSKQLKELRADCVRRGYAEIITDEYGESIFELRDPNSN